MWCKYFLFLVTCCQNRLLTTNIKMFISQHYFCFCQVCESFVNVRDLVHCGLFKAMLDDLGGQVSGARDRVSYRSDGTWKLKDENRLRYRNKRKNEGGGNCSAATKAAASDDVIELL